ncbi:MAG: hypothetical protein ABR921_12520 [Candidatus Sulfotelmatobacter sp.]
MSTLPTIIAATGALGTAAFGLVDACKVLPGGGISRSGFKFIRQTILKLAPEVAVFDGTGLSRDSLLFTLQSHWINGTATTDQLNIAKSLIKLRLIPDTAAALARATGVDAEILTQIAACINTGAAFTPQQRDVYGRFDLLLTTLLDQAYQQAYQRADQRYRNATKFTAIPISVGLAVIAAHVLPDHITVWQAVLLGLIATPIAPVAKDVASAVTAAVQAVQSWNG